MRPFFCQRKGLFFGGTVNEQTFVYAKEYFFWIRPDCEVDADDFHNLTECEYILKKDSLFDRYIITDFEFEQQTDGSLTPYPVCPKCGTRRFS